MLQKTQAETGLQYSGVNLQLTYLYSVSGECVNGVMLAPFIIFPVRYSVFHIDMFI